MRAAWPSCCKQKRRTRCSGRPVQIVFPTLQRKAQQFHQALALARQVPAQAEQPLAVVAKGIQGERDRLAIRPEDAVAFEVNLTG